MIKDRGFKVYMVNWQNITYIQYSVLLFNTSHKAQTFDNMTKLSSKYSSTENNLI